MVTRIRSTLLIPLSDAECVCIDDGILAFDTSGTILYCGPQKRFFAPPNQPSLEIAARDSILLPGFYDLHFHWVQDRVRLAGKASLLNWLQEHTFPAEARFASVAYARQEAAGFWPLVAGQGVVGGAVYASTHFDALQPAFEQAGGDFRIGNVLMTMNAPSGLMTHPDAAIASVKQGISDWGDRYITSPRFALMTDPGTMRLAAQLAHRQGGFLQTHLSESRAEIRSVLETYRKLPGFEDVKTYTEIYDRCGLLGPRSIFGHGIHLSDPERQRLAATASIIAHCPTSNAPVEELGLGSGLFDFQAADAAGLRWGLASDIGAGPYLSPFDVMRSFVEQNHRAGRTSATYCRALYRSTVGNAELLGYQSGLASGKPANFVLVNKPTPTPQPRTAENWLEALHHPLAHDRSRSENLVQQTWYQGKQIFP